MGLGDVGYGGVEHLHLGPRPAEGVGQRPGVLLGQMGLEGGGVAFGRGLGEKRVDGFPDALLQVDGELSDAVTPLGVLGACSATRFLRNSDSENEKK